MKKIWLILFFCGMACKAEAMKVDTALLNEMLTTLNAEYLHKIDNARLITAGLQILPDFDKQFTVSQGPNRIYVYYNGKITAVLPFPKDENNLPEWSSRIADTLAAAGKISENLAAHDYELPDLMLKKMAQSLDKYSHYYSQFDYVEEGDRTIFHTTFSERMIDDALYLRVGIFNKQTARQIERALKTNRQATAAILDLRGNSGGMLNEALKTADFFTDNEIITVTAGREDKNKHYYTSSEECIFTKPLVILVDGDTASAAEVLAAGLQEQSRAKIAGTRTFGKGTIQNVLQMSNGGKLVLTGEQFFTPSGQIIHEKGVMPDVCTEYDLHDECAPQPRAGKDEDISTALEMLGK